MKSKFFLCIGVFLSLVACSDVVISKYATLQDARDDELFQRGWLPDILPDSASSIHTSNDPDINISAGEFTLAIRDVDSFIQRLSEVEPPFDGHAEYIVKMQDKGYEGFIYTDGMTWLFLCNRKSGRCTYRLPYDGEGS